MSLILSLALVGGAWAAPVPSTPLQLGLESPAVVAVAAPATIGPLDVHRAPQLFGPPGDELRLSFPIELVTPGDAFDATEPDALDDGDIPDERFVASTDADELAAGCPLHTPAASMRALGRWLIVLLAMVFAVALLGSLGSARRPLPLAAVAVRHPSRPVPLVERLLVLACLWSPMLMLLSLLQAEREMLSSLLLCVAVTGSLCAAAMLGARRRLLARLRWAVSDALRAQKDGTLARVEVEPRRLAPPPGATGPVPWFAADLLVETAGTAEGATEAARVGLDGAIVDESAARVLVRMAMGLPARGQASRLTVLAPTGLAPADAAAVSPFERGAPVQARLGGAGRGALIVAGSPEALARRLRGECLLLGSALLASLSAALLVL